MEELKLHLDIKADGRYKFDRAGVRKAVREVLRENRLRGKVNLSVAVVGDRKMSELRKKHLDEDGTTDVLSFAQDEASEEDGLMLGDVVVSYPRAKRQALEYYKTLDEEINFLVCHGVLHLLGIHHE